VIAVVSAVPLRGITDARPEIDRILALEARTARAYQTALDEFRKGRITAEAVVQTIDGTIMPELQTANTHLRALHGVPHQQELLLGEAERYLQLRTELWRLRAEGLRKSKTPSGRPTDRSEPTSGANWRVRAEAQHKADLLTLGKAEAIERASLEVLHRITFD
jgi:hypothetical protein